MQHIYQTFFSSMNEFWFYFRSNCFINVALLWKNMRYDGIKIIQVYWVFYFKCECRRKNCTYVWEGDQSTKATMSSWHKCEFSPQNWDGFGIKTEVVVQLFSQTTWLWRLKPVKTATVKNTCKLLSHKTVTFNNDNQRSDPPERTPRSPHSFRNHDNGSETSDRTSQSG